MTGISDSLTTTGRHDESLERIPLIRPFMNDEIKRRVCQVLDSGFLTEGAVTKEFEKEVKDYIGCKYAIAFNSCTTGLEVALRALSIGPGDQVIVPDYTYPATADVVSIVGAQTVIVDVSKKTMLIDYDKLENAITPSTKAIIPVSLFGNPLDYDRLNAIKNKYGVFIIEDAACSLGAEYNQTKVGNLADITVFSFHPRKFITTGEGGMVTTNNSEWSDWILSYKHFGLKADPSSRAGASFKMTGTNYKLSDVLAAIGLAQMENIDMLLSRRINLSDNYIALLQDCTEVEIPATTPNGRHSRQSFCIYVENRDKILREMRSRNIEVQIGTYSLHTQPAFSPGDGCKVHSDLTGSSYAFQHCLTLPLFHDLTDDQQAYVVENLKRLL